MSEAPPFWFQKPGIAAWALAPVGWLYGRVAARRMQFQTKYVSTLPVICVGNLITGGAGKTPTALALAKIAKSQKLRPGFLSRGYGGSASSATLVDTQTHNARDVGDEPLLLAEHGPTVVSAVRPSGAKLLEEQDVDLIIMDDGFQNPALHKDFSLVVIDAYRGIGNGFCMPAGPVRATLKVQLAQASAVLLIGRADGAAGIVRTAAKMAKPILQADTYTRAALPWKGKKVLAYAGIADPAKFYRSLELIGAEVVECRNFHDHHFFTQEDCNDLIQQAEAKNLELVTTEKDLLRLSNTGGAQDVLHSLSQALPIELMFENPKQVANLIKDTVQASKDLRLKLAKASNSPKS